MNKTIQARIDNDYNNKIIYIKKFLKNINLEKEEEITNTEIIKYCIRWTYNDITKEVNKNLDFYKEKGL